MPWVQHMWLCNWLLAQRSAKYLKVEMVAFPGGMAFLALLSSNALNRVSGAMRGSQGKSSTHTATLYAPGTEPYSQYGPDVLSSGVQGSAEKELGITGSDLHSATYKDDEYLTFKTPEAINRERSARMKKLGNGTARPEAGAAVPLPNFDPAFPEYAAAGAPATGVAGAGASIPAGAAVGDAVGSATSAPHPHRRTWGGPAATGAGGSGGRGGSGAGSTQAAAGAAASTTQASTGSFSTTSTSASASTATSAQTSGTTTMPMPAAGGGAGSRRIGGGGASASGNFSKDPTAEEYVNIAQHMSTIPEIRDPAFNAGSKTKPPSAGDVDLLMSSYTGEVPESWREHTNAGSSSGTEDSFESGKLGQEVEETERGLGVIGSL